jgi:hypothetical protein
MEQNDAYSPPKDQNQSAHNEKQKCRLNLALKRGRKKHIRRSSHITEDKPHGPEKNHRLDYHP